MKLGFTGTRNGLTPEQRQALNNIFGTGNNYITAVHYGMCKGADTEFYNLVRSKAFWKCNVVGHPPVKTAHYVYTDCDEYIESLLSILCAIE